MISAISKVNIRPESGILAVLSHLNYKPWYALAEFVDNSLQSYIENSARLRALHGEGFVLKVGIDIDPSGTGRISVKDNAAGIAAVDFPRAFKPAQAPPDRTGLSEFGIGMKSAACWFARRWSVRTSALGEPVEREVRFDVEEIRRTEVEALQVEETPADPDLHFTEIVLEDLFQAAPQRRTLGKIKEHLRGIYRRFTKSGMMELRLGPELLCYAEPEVLSAPRFGNDNEPVDDSYVEWRKPLSFEFGDGCSAVGFAGLLKTGSTASAGFALFRRDRLVVGSGDETYRPFGSSNSYTYQRLFGELDLRGVRVSHTKDGFKWEDHEEEFLQKLKQQLDEEPLPLLRQAENYRTTRYRGTPAAITLQERAEDVSERTVEALRQEAQPELERQATMTQPPPPEPLELPEATTIHAKPFDLEICGCRWAVRIELCDDPAQGAFLEVAEHPEYQRTRRMAYRMGLHHPFVRRFLGANQENLELFYRFAAAVVLAEATTRCAGPDGQAQRMRRAIGEILKPLATR